jgi:hypothetical protein
VTETDDPRRSAQRMAEATGQLAHSTRSLSRPSDSYVILGELLETQRAIEQTLRQLAEWHRTTSAGVHYAEGHEESALGIMTSVAELDLAAQQAEGLLETLARAYGGNSVVHWFDSIE